VGRGAVLPRPRTPDVTEAGSLQHREEDLPRHGAGDSVGPEGLVRRGLLPDQPDVTCLEPTAWAQEPKDLLQYSRLVWDQIQDAIADGNIEGASREGQGFNGRLAEFGLQASSPGTAGFCHGEHLGRKVDSHNPSHRSDDLGRDEGVEACTAAQIQHRLAGDGSAPG
jgi:hypothetical protein